MFHVKNQNKNALTCANQYDNKTYATFPFDIHFEDFFFVQFQPTHFCLLHGQTYWIVCILPNSIKWKKKHTHGFRGFNFNISRNRRHQIDPINELRNICCKKHNSFFLIKITSLNLKFVFLSLEFFVRHKFNKLYHLYCTVSRS